MSNFEGVVKKNANSFRPQTRASDGAGVGKTVAGLWPGQDTVTVFEKADQPVLDTTPTPRTDGAGESELGLSGLVDHPNNDGGAKYLAGKIARVYRQLTSDGADLESLSVAERRAKRDALIQGVYDGDGQHPSGEAGSTSQTNTVAYITGVANVLFGLADEIPGTPTFLTRMAKSASVEVSCPHCNGANSVERSDVGGLQKITCGSCGKPWQQDVTISTFAKSSGNPDLAALRKQLLTLTENIRTILARRAGVSTGTSGSGSRFVTKAATGNDPKRLLKAAARFRLLMSRGTDHEQKRCGPDSGADDFSAT